jgi:hypothetical protein
MNIALRRIRAFITIAQHGRFAPAASSSHSREVLLARVSDLSNADTDPMPIPPARPEPADCCNGGCERCVFDLYDDAMDRYRIQLEAWRARREAENAGRPR